MAAARAEYDSFIEKGYLKGEKNIAAAGIGVGGISTNPKDLIPSFIK